MSKKLIAAVVLSLPPLVSPAAETPFSFATVEATARALAAKPYAREPEVNPPFFQNMEYDDAAQIVFKPDHALWAGTDSPWKLQFFNPAKYHDRITRTYAVDNGVATEVPFDPKAFDYGNVKIPAGTPYPAGYAGFRINGRMNPEHSWEDEFAVFVGATYFRCVPTGVDAIYGLSARAIAIDTADPVHAEEFPFFRKFWIERAPASAKSVVIDALMDSPTVAGAFRITITPGPHITSAVKTALFFRARPDRLGLAPFSSMFAYGENSARKLDDYRAEVHDSDGLLIEENNGHRIWRPLENDTGGTIRESVFGVTRANGFGLRQRHLDYVRYADLDNHYHKRPGVWVATGPGWPEGAVHLFELPTGEEDWDNIVTYWQPTHIPGPGESLHYEYTITWALEPDFHDPLSRVISTHRGSTARLGVKPANPAVVRLLVDFSAVADGDAKAPGLTTEVSGGTKIVAARLDPNGVTGGWRATLDILPPAPGLDYGVRARLMRGDRVVSETWDARPVPAKPAPAPVIPANSIPTIPEAPAKPGV